MKRLLIALFTASISTIASAAPTMWAFKCGKTIVSWEKEPAKEGEKGSHLYATWKDQYGYHSRVELYLNGSMPNDDGLIEQTYFFHELDDKGNITKGGGIMMNYVPKKHKWSYSLSNVKVDNGQQDANEVFKKGTCILTDAQ